MNMGKIDGGIKYDLEHFCIVACNRKAMNGGKSHRSRNDLGLEIIKKC